MKAKRQRKDFSYTCNTRGYMLYYKGHPLGGAGTLPSDKPMHWRHKRANLHMYKESAEYDIARLIQGNGQSRYLDIIDKKGAAT